MQVCEGQRLGALTVLIASLVVYGGSLSMTVTRFRNHPCLGETRDRG